LFAKATTLKNLIATYESKVAATNARGRDGVHPAQLDQDIRPLARRLSRSMRDGTHRFTTYRERLLSKGAGRPPRVLSIATARDRIVLKALADFLQAAFPQRVLSTAQGKVDELKSALEFAAYDTFVRIDVREFFPSISHDALFREISAVMRIRAPRELVRKAVTTATVADGKVSRAEKPGRGVPQGLAISNILAEIVLGSLDERFARSAAQFYIRFVDDVLILCQRDEARRIYDEFAREAGALGLAVHALEEKGSKSAIGSVSEGFTYLGYNFVGTSVSVREESVRRVEAAIARVFTRYRHQRSRSAAKKYQKRILRELQWRLDLIITGCTFHKVRRGWVAYYSQITDLSVLKRLDAVVDRSVRRFEVEFERRPKSFMRTYWRIRYPAPDHGAYVPNFDDFSNVEKRKLLVKVLGEAAARSMTNAQIDSHFTSRVFKIVRELETHIGDVS
jgi:Retron-type reverse transcriptase